MSGVVAFKRFVGASRAVPVHLLLLVVQACFASVAVFGRMALATMPPAAILLARIAGGAAVFYLIARGRGPLAVSRADLPRLVACAVLGVAANQVLFIYGLARSTAVNASVLCTSIPVFTLLFAMIAGTEPLRWLRLAGIAVALAGGLALVGADRLSLADGHAAGNLMILANSSSYALFLVLARTLSPRVPPLTIVAVAFLIGAVLVAPLGIPAWVELAPRLTWRDAGLLAFLVAVPTVAAYWLNQLALARADASLVAVYIYVQPLLATAGAVLLLDERPGARAAVAAALIACGMALAWLPARGDRSRR